MITSLIILEFKDMILLYKNESTRIFSFSNCTKIVSSLNPNFKILFQSSFKARLSYS